jgi:hypothetical protein
MIRLTTEVRAHDLHRVVCCCLCGTQWEEQLVAVNLLACDQEVGTLCPRCLERRPAELAHELIESATRLRRLREELEAVLVDQPVVVVTTGTGATAEPAACSQGRPTLLDLSRQIREQARRVRPAAVAARRALGAFPRAQARLHPELVAALPHRPWVLDQTELVCLLAAGLARLDAWPATVDEVVRAERRRLTQRYVGVAEHDARRAVEGRFTEFLVSPG